MKLIEKILLSLFFYPMFVMLGILYGLIIMPVDLLDQVIWHDKENWV